MLSNSQAPPRTRAARPKVVRDLQRIVHLLAAVMLTGYVYLAPPPGSAPAVAVRWVGLPVLVGTGVALWKWTTMRRWWRRRAQE
jgi:hypothetical protein